MYTNGFGRTCTYSSGQYIHTVVYIPTVEYLGSLEGNLEVFLLFLLWRREESLEQAREVESLELEVYLEQAGEEFREEKEERRRGQGSPKETRGVPTSSSVTWRMKVYTCTVSAGEWRCTYVQY